MNKETLNRRAKQTESLEKDIRSICRDLDKIPSFTGKARFIDKVSRATNFSHTLALDLRLDAKIAH